MRILIGIGRILWSGIVLFGLLCGLGLEGMFYSLEFLTGKTSQKPKIITGTEPVGAKPIVRGGSKSIKWGARKIRLLIGRKRGRLWRYLLNYVQRYYPRFYRVLRRFI
ncbi:hypothetical protein DEJ39_08680 [Bacteroidetes bacterium SCGC AAA795-G10]|nr:hypothetical protein DEJ39_08680 [Bacteroidetes bacterium SCGC AAA795-G10]